MSEVGGQFISLAGLLINRSMSLLSTYHFRGTEKILLQLVCFFYVSTLILRWVKFHPISNLSCSLLGFPLHVRLLLRFTTNHTPTHGSIRSVRGGMQGPWTEHKGRCWNRALPCRPVNAQRTATSIGQNKDCVSNICSFQPVCSIMSKVRSSSRNHIKSSRRPSNGIPMIRLRMSICDGQGMEREGLQRSEVYKDVW